MAAPQDVTLGDGHSLEGTAIGTVKLETLLPDGSTKRCILNNVLLVPKLSYSLLSVSKASEAGKTTRYNKSGCEILKVVAFATRVGNLYYLEHCSKNQKLNVTEESKERLWHRRYGHIGEQNLKNLASGELVEQFDYNTSRSIGFCESCIGGKQHRTPFDNSSRQTSELLELIHSDVCGKISEKSVGGAQYFLTFTDDKTRYTWVYTLKTKDQVFECFLAWKALVEKATKRKVRTFRTDNGGEYTSTQFKNYLKGEGIRHELTIPKTPEQNGVSERLNRTLVEMTRSMLLDSKLPKKFWAEAVSTADYLKNRSPSKALNMTPYEAWYSSKPRVNRLRVFGCDAYTHIPKDERTKFDSKTRKCIMVGYGTVTKGYRLYDMKEKKIIRSRDVHFNDYQLIVDLSNDADMETDHDVEHKQSNSEDPGHDEMPRRSTREKKHPDYFGREYSSLCETPQQPTSFQEATTSPDKVKWEVARDDLPARE